MGFQTKSYFAVAIKSTARRLERRRPMSRACFFFSLYCSSKPWGFPSTRLCKVPVRFEGKEKDLMTFMKSI